MAVNKNLLKLVIAYIVINLLLVNNLNETEHGNGIIFVYIFPLLWIVMLIAVVVYVYKDKKELFSKRQVFLNIILLFLSTPLTTGIASYLINSDIELSVSSYISKKGGVIRYEEWVYRHSQKTAIIKFWKSNAENHFEMDDKNFKKDSNWIYFDKKGDTIKIEKYKNDSLIYINQKK